MYLRLAKHIAYECPIVHISDTFYKLLHKHVVSFNFVKSASEQSGDVIELIPIYVLIRKANFRMSVFLRTPFLLSLN